MGCCRIWVGGTGDFPFRSRRVSQTRRKGPMTITGQGKTPHVGCFWIRSRPHSTLHRPIRPPPCREPGAGPVHRTLEGDGQAAVACSKPISAALDDVLRLWIRGSFVLHHASKENQAALLVDAREQCIGRVLSHPFRAVPAAL